jgi:hypothetical protein
MRKIVLALCALFVMFAAETSLAADFGFIPRVGVGYSNYSFKWSEQLAQDATDITTIADLTVDLPTGTVGATTVFGRFYIDLYLQQSLDGSDEYTIEGFTNPLDWDVNVFDYAITAGFNVWSGLALYGGWKGHETDLDAVGTGTTWDENFESSGWFFGAKYGWAIGEGNMLSINCAYALLESDFTGHQEFDATGEFYWPAGTTRDFRANDGDAGGLTLGIAWTGFFTEALGYTINADWYSYDYDDFKHEYSLNGAAFQETNWVNEVEETAFSLRFIISYVF